MQKTKNKDPAKMLRRMAIIAAIVILVIAAPLVLPVYRTWHLDWFDGWKDLSSQMKVDEDVLRKEYTFVFRYHPRGDNDPIPWQLAVKTASDTPPWVVDDKGVKKDEYQTLVRVSLISDRDGKPPSTFMMRANLPKEKYAQATGWRLPPGSLGQNPKRSVFLYQASTWERLEIHQALIQHELIEGGLRRANDTEKGWLCDDDVELFPWRDDGYRKPGQQ